MGFPGGSEVKASVCNVGDLDSIPGSGRFPGEGNGNPLQYSCLENPRDLGAWWAIQSTGSQRVGHDWATSLSLSLFWFPNIERAKIMMDCSKYFCLKYILSVYCMEMSGLDRIWNLLGTMDVSGSFSVISIVLFANRLLSKRRKEEIRERERGEIIKKTKMLTLGSVSVR